MKHVLKTVAVGIAGAFFALNASAADVKLGYQLVVGPWKAQMKDIGKNGLGGKSVDLIQFNSGADVIAALASKDVDISLNGSSSDSSRLQPRYSVACDLCLRQHQRCGSLGCRESLSKKTIRTRG